MSRLPQSSRSIRPPQIKTRTVTGKTAAGGTKTITSTSIRQLEEVSSSGPPKAGPSGIRPPSAQVSRSIRPPQAGGMSRMQPSRPVAPPRRPPPMAQPPPMQPMVPGQYSVPAPYGPMTRTGRDMVYSSPPDLRSQMESRMPKDLKYAKVPGPSAGVRDRSTLPGTTMHDTFAGQFNVYGGGQMPQSHRGFDLDQTEKLIRKKINARGLEYKFPTIIDSIMNDTREEFKKITHFAGVNMKVKEKFEEDFTIQNYKYLGKTENYQRFLCTRKQFGLRWILHYDLMRNVLKKCVVELPYFLFDLQFNEVMTFAKLRHILREKVNSTSELLQDFHKSALTLYDNSKPSYKKRPSKFLPACTGLFSIYISRSIAHTMKKIVEFTSCKKPYLEMIVDFEKGLVLRPEKTEVINLFDSLLDDLIEIGQNLDVLEKSFIPKSAKKMCLCLTGEFIQECRRQILENVSKLYEPVMEYLDRLSEEFSLIYDDICSETLVHATDVRFEEGCERIKYYKSFIQKVAYIPSNDYFQIGKLDLTSYREKLHQSLHAISNAIFNNIAAQNLWEMSDICDSFFLIETRACETPITTEELIEIGNFMNWIKTEQLDELTTRVHEGLRSLCDIIMLGVMEEDHMSKNCEAFKWLESITPVIDQHSINYEQMKFEAEEGLQKVIEEISVLVTNTYPYLVQLDDMDDITQARQYLGFITFHMNKIKEINKKIEWINNEETCLSFPKSSYTEFEHLKDYVYPFYHLLKLSLEVQRNVSVWRHGQFDLLDYETANIKLSGLSEELTELQKIYRKKLRQAQDDNLPIRFKGTVDDPDMLNWPAPLKLCGTSLNILNEFKPSLQVMKIMCNNALQKRHWQSMSEIAGFNLMPNAGTTLKKLIDLNLQDKLGEYEIISTCASKEKLLLDHLNALKLQWSEVHFKMDRLDCIDVLVELDEIVLLVDDHQMQLQTMRSSVFVKPYESHVKAFQGTLNKIHIMIDNWRLIQDSYLELLPIFSQDVVKVHIAETAKEFQTCQEIFQKYCDEIPKKSLVMEVISQTLIVDDLNYVLELLDKVYRGINDYLSVIREICPRLYLLSNGEIIQLIAMDEEFHRQTFITKIFPGIHKVLVSATDMVAMTSEHGEIIDFKQNILIINNLAELLNLIGEQMVSTLKHLTSDCYKVFKRTLLPDLMKKFPQQSLQLMTNVFFTEQIENALKLSHNIKLLILKKKIHDNIEEKITMIQNTSNLQKEVLTNLLINDLNNQHILTSLLKDDASGQHFEWQVQLKFYIHQSQCSAKVLDNSIDYSYEYLGNFQPIVVTPLSEKCYVTFLRAYFYHYFAYIKGEEQTGKMSTIRSLAYALGKLFITFQCMDTMENLGQIVKGIVACGGWLYLKHVDKLKVDVVSKLGQNLLNILNSKKILDDYVHIDDAKIPFNSSVFFFMQSSSPLHFPENFKVILRTFTMTEPDFLVVIEALSASQGVKNYKHISKKIWLAIQLFRDLLNGERQYIFGMREIRKMLKLYEKMSLCECFRKVFSSMITTDDLQNFEGILKDVLQDLYVVEVDHSLDEKFKSISENLNLSLTTEFTGKLRQLHDCLKYGNKLLLLGGCFTGKTTALKICLQTDENIKFHVINPICLSYADLIGHTSITDKNTTTWSDGVLQKILRNPEKTYILFDSIDDKCQDFLNTIYLETLEIFPIPPHITLIFETSSLNNASPTEVSALQTIYFPDSTLTCHTLIERSIRSNESECLQDNSDQIESILKWFVPSCIQSIEELSLQPFCQLNTNCLVKNCLEYFHLIMDDACGKITRKDEDYKNISSWIHASLIQAGLYAFCSFLPLYSRQKFDEMYKQLWRGQLKPYPDCVERLEVGIPSENLLYDYFYLYKQRGTWKFWTDLLKNEKLIYSPDLDFCIIPTVDTLRSNYIVDLHVKFARNLLIVGPRSTGKSLTMRDCFLHRLPEKKFEKSLVSVTDNLNLQELLLDKMTKTSSSQYAPSGQKRFVCFLDDLHYSSHYSQETLRQLLDHNCWYYMKNPINLTRVQFLGSMSHDQLTGRLMRHFNVYGINALTTDNLSKIYSQNLMFFWKKSGFPSDMLTAVNQMVNASLFVYSKVQTLKPTLAKSHYQFDLSSLYRLIHGCTFLKKETYDSNKKIHVKLWAHEVFRVFGDGFYVEDIRFLREVVKKAAVDNFGDEFEEEDLQVGRAFFTTVNGKNYDEVNFEQLKDICCQTLKKYNNEAVYKMDLIFFQYSLEKLCRLCRLLAMPYENALLLGLNGCGRQSLVKFCSFMCHFEFFQAKITRSYSLEVFNEEFKKAMIRSGGSNRKCTFLACEEQLLHDTYLQIIDYYIRDGEITDLYNKEQKQEILELSRLAAQGGNRNIEISSQKVFMYFNHKCHENLQLFLSMDTSKLRERLVKYPSLARKLNIILWKDWPDKALSQIGSHFMQNIFLDDQVKEQTISAAMYFHRSCKNSPRNYLHTMRLFNYIINKKQQKLLKKKRRYEQGLSKLSYAAIQIENMQKALAEYQPLLAQMTKNAIEMTNQIALETIQVEKASALVRQDEKIASEQAVIAQVLKNECEAELAQAIPILEDAISALNTLKPSDITLVKSMKNPPDAIKLVMASVCVIKDVKPDRIPDPSTGRKTYDYWSPSKRILGDMNFLQTLKDFDKDHIKPEIMIKIRKEYLPHKDFKPHIVAKASSAAEGLCKWIIAMDMYDRVAKEVAPKKEKLNNAEKEYGDTMLVLNQKKEEVVRIEEKLAQLHVLLDEATKKQIKLQFEVDICNKKLGSAQKLIGGLSGERLRWTSAVENLQMHYDELAGDIIMSSAIISYTSSMDFKARNETISQWKLFIQENLIPSSKNFKLSAIMSNAVQLEKWTEQGLPPHEFFIENAIIHENTKLFSLFYDPHGQAYNWIINTEPPHNLIITKFAFKNWLMELKRCVKLGKSILIKDTEGNIPPCLNSLICGDKYVKDDLVYVKIDDEHLALHPNTHIYICCLRSNFHYSSNPTSRTTVINFTCTPHALQEHVLKIVVEIEKPEIQKLSRELTQKTKENKADLKQLERKILNTLCESEADILEDEESIVILDKSKELTEIAMKKQLQTKEIADTIENFRIKYVSVAKHVSCLFFCVDHMQRLHHLYHFSLKWFENIYFISILNAGKSRSLEMRCKNLCDTFTYDLYASVNKGLFEEHKLLFAFMLATEVACCQNKANKHEVEIFFNLRNLYGLKELPRPDFIDDDEKWAKLQQLEELDIFTGIAQSFLQNRSWKHYIDSQQIPSSWNTNLQYYGRLILTQLFQQELLYDEIKEFIRLILGDQFLDPTFFSMQEIYNESYSLMPVIFILTPGFNVLKILHEFAAVKQVLHKFKHLSMNSRNIKKADELISKGKKEGGWVLLQNCHYRNWLSDLEFQLESLDFENTSENFRLFLSVGSSHQLPLELIQNSIKIVEEYPNNFRKSLIKAYNKSPLKEEFFYECPGQQEQFSKLLYGLCHFHFILQERRAIANWNITYSFNETDLIWSLQLMKEFVNQQQFLFEKIYFLIGECNYNSYLSSQWEKRFTSVTLKSLLNISIFDKRPQFIKLPLKTDRRDYIKFIYNLPDQDDPETLYLNKKELTEHELIKSQCFLDRGLHIWTDYNVKCIMDEQFKILCIIDEVCSLLPEKVHNVDEDTRFLQQEKRLYINLLDVVKSSLRRLKASFLGDEVFDEDMYGLAESLYHNQIPALWLKHCFPTLLTLSSFAKRLCSNVDYLNNFTFANKNIKLHIFFYPHSIFAQIKMNFSRETQTDIEDLHLHFISENNEDESFLVLDDLFIFGAKFTGCMEELPLNCRYTPLKILVKVTNQKVEESHYKCCLFRTQPGIKDEFLNGTRNFVTYLFLKVDRERDNWVRRGVYAVCEISQ